jgi:cystathionine gamma-synthase
MTHVGMGPEALRAAGISDGLLRLSVGLEAEADLVAGLEAGFAAIASV